MTHYCPRCAPPNKLIYQPAKLRYWCAHCGLNYTRREAAIVGVYVPPTEVEAPAMREWTPPPRRQA